MSVKITPALKGLITAALMTLVFLYVYTQGKEAGTALQYTIYAIYGLGIIWTLVAYRQSAAYTGKFGDLFSQGFKCFIVVTLCMVLFYGLFNYFHPEIKEDMARVYREELGKLTGEKQMLPADIDTEVATFKKQYLLRLVYSSIFGYLIIGAAVTAAASALLSRRNS